MTAEALFLYGTLRHPDVLAQVSGCVLSSEPAELVDHAIAHAITPDGRTQDFPIFTPRPGSVARGLLIRPDAEARARLDAYERAFGYDTTKITVRTAAGPVEASIYLPRPGLWLAGKDWSLEAWMPARGPLAVEVAREVMALLPRSDPGVLRERYRMLEIRAASRLRARDEPAPATLRRQPTQQDIIVEAARVPYAWFFGVEEADLRFRRFDGSTSAVVTRAGFIMGDAVTVLPYDPRRDRVMLVEQFRFGPFARGDANAWSLEPIAGRVDPGETPDEAARRETTEEAALSLQALHPIGRYYASPGAVSEYLMSYVAIADLPDAAQGVNGLETEAEDIRSHVISYARLMDLVASGEVENAPLLISAQWLALNRDRLRATTQA